VWRRPVRARRPPDTPPLPAGAQDGVSGPVRPLARAPGVATPDDHGGARCCGTGHALNLMAQAYPRSTFTGYDLAEDATDRARAEAAAWG
jgi:hypothetical protein